MAHSIVLNWNFVHGEPVVESTLDGHTEMGDFVPRYRFTRSGNGATIIFKVEDGQTSSPIGHIRWSNAIHSSSIYLRSNFFGGRNLGSGIPLNDFRRKIDGSPDAREFTINGRTFFWMRANEHLQDMVCWYRDIDNGGHQCAAFYEENGNILTIHAAGQLQGDIIDEIPISCVVNLHMRNMQLW